MKRIVVCCDGTWNIPDQVSPTNVVKVALALADRDSSGVPQRVFYNAGLGTSRGERLRGGAFGFGLSKHVRECYRFLVENYEPGDELYFFGFSRGAFTARSTAGLVRNSGILRREHASRLGDAYAIYRGRDPTSHPRGTRATLFRRSFSHEPRVHFIGVWDTVGALGIPVLGPGWANVLNRRWEFHDTDLSTMVDLAYQALAIDETRGPFVPSLWNRQDEARNQVLEQVWFAGVHSDVGGGYDDCALAEIPLLWLVDRAASAGLEFRQGHFSGRRPDDPRAVGDERAAGRYVGPERPRARARLAQGDLPVAARVRAQPRARAGRRPGGGRLRPGDRIQRARPARPRRVRAGAPPGVPRRGRGDPGRPDDARPPGPVGEGAAVSLRVVSRAALGLSELSAFAVREADGASELLCVGDREHDLLAIPLGDGAALGEEARHDLRPLVDAPGASGFEGLACDGAGRVLILQEGQCRVIVLAPGLARLEAAIELAVARDQPGFGREWAEDENARGEGLLLMQRGHLLVAKQKEPVCLIEFGPPGDAPSASRPGPCSGRGTKLALARRREDPVRYEVLAWWRLSRPSAKRIESANDLALDEEAASCS